MVRTILPTLCAIFVALCVACAGRPSTHQPPATTPPPKYIVITGDVIDVNAQRCEVFILSVNPGLPGEGFRCHCREGEEAKLLRVKDGQRLTVRGRVPAKQSDPARLEDCTVQD